MYALLGTVGRGRLICMIHRTSTFIFIILRNFKLNLIPNRLKSFKFQTNENITFRDE